MSGLAGSQSLPVLLPASYRSLKPLPSYVEHDQLVRSLAVSGGGTQAAIIDWDAYTQVQRWGCESRPLQPGPQGLFVVRLL